MNKDIYEIINSLSKIYQSEQIRLTDKVNFIISNKVTDKNIIERTIDEIISIPTTKAFMLASRLNNYYSNLDYESSKEYKKIIRTIYEEDLWKY